ncbi:MAG: glycosyltransferase [Sphingobacteriaceae bacterium]|nr:MAG: glycosyltransferase [Sphingobacteriaceae bacterium]
MQKKTKCSLIIATYNWPRALHVCLLSAITQQHLPDEIIIADDGSGSDTAAVVKHFQNISPVPVHHIWHADEGFRKTIILNMAVKRAAFDYIIQVDGDVILEKHFIADHLLSAEPETFLRGTRAMLTPERTECILSAQKSNISIFSKGIKHRNNALRLIGLRRLGARKKMSSDSVRGSNLSFWKADFIRVNGYNNDLAGWGHEDEELAARFINNGIIKKIIKLCAVQYHLWHPVTDKANEPHQREVVEQVKRNKIMQCDNGYNQVILNA